MNVFIYEDDDIFQYSTIWQKIVFDIQIHYRIDKHTRYEVNA